MQSIEAADSHRCSNAKKKKYVQLYTINFKKEKKTLHKSCGTNGDVKLLAQK